jgi:hypothetical protein
LKEEPRRYEQPLYLAVPLAELAISTSTVRIQCANLRLNGLEKMMGQHEYANMRKGRPLDINFESATASLNFHTQWLALQSMRLDSALLALDQILFETREIANRYGRNIGRLDLMSSTAESDSLCMMEKFAAYLVNTAKNLLLRVQKDRGSDPSRKIFPQLILGIELTRKVYQFMAHKNANLNIE